WAGRLHLEPAARAQPCARDAAGIAFRLRPRFSRRHRPPLDAGIARSTGTFRQIAPNAAWDDSRHAAAIEAGRHHDRRSAPAADTVPLRNDAAAGEIAATPRRRRAEIP